ncbi:MAG: hypothetical protein ACRDTD_00140 [Pseudonocardiaceae bacterium]
MSSTPSTLRVHENGQPIDFTFDEISGYHGFAAPGGVAHAFKVMERAFPILDPDAPVERREIEIATPFAGPGARDAFECVTRAVTGERYTIDPFLERPDVGPTQAKFVFHLSYRGRTVHLHLRPGQVSDEFIELARQPELSDAEEKRLDALKLEMADHIMSQAATEIYDQV